MKKENSAATKNVLDLHALSGNSSMRAQIPAAKEPVVEAWVSMDALPEDAEPVIHCSVFLNDADDPLVSRDYTADEMFAGLIEAHSIPGFTVRPEHRDFLLKTIAHWKDAVKRAERTVEGLHCWSEPEAPKKKKPSAKNK